MTANTPSVTLEHGDGNTDPAPLQIVRVPPVKLDTLRHVRDEVARVYRECRCGRLPTAEGTRLVFMLGQLRDLILAMDIETRITRLEAKNGTDRI